MPRASKKILGGYLFVCLFVTTCPRADYDQFYLHTYTHTETIVLYINPVDQ
jgi:hypothetical protein